MPPSVKVLGRMARSSSRQVPQRQALLYLMTDANFAYVADYPNGASLHRVSVGTNLTGTGICSDKSGHVFMTGYNRGTSVKGYVFEFAHGGASPIATLNTSEAPSGCSVDPITGNLAVTGTYDGNCEGGTVEIYAGSTGTQTTYDVSGFVCLTGAAYDDQGNLFVGGGTGLSGLPYAIAELPHGSSEFTSIALNEQITCARGNCDVPLQWDGSHLVITKPTADHKSPIVYRVQVSGSVGTVVGTTTFQGNFGSVSGTGAWVQGDKMILTYRRDNVALWAYPAGGKVLKVLKGFKGFAHPGLTISQ